MAQRFNVSIPDELAARLEPHKSQLSLSEVMQNALELELARLTKSDSFKANQEGINATAERFFKADHEDIANAVSRFVDTLVEAAVHDGDVSMFEYLRERKGLWEYESDPIHKILEVRFPEFMNSLIERGEEPFSQMALESAGYNYHNQISTYDGEIWDSSIVMKFIDEEIESRLILYLGEQGLKKYIGS